MSRTLNNTLSTALLASTFFGGVQGFAQETVVSETADATLALITSDEIISSAIFRFGFYATIAISILFALVLVQSGWKVYRESGKEGGEVSMGRFIFKTIKRVTAAAIGLSLMLLALGAFPMTMSKTLAKITNSFSAPIKK